MLALDTGTGGAATGPPTARRKVKELEKGSLGVKSKSGILQCNARHALTNLWASYGW